MATLTDVIVSELRTIAEQFLQSRKGTLLGDEAGVGASAVVFRLTGHDDTRTIKVYDPRLFKGEAGAAELRRLKLQENLIGHACPTLVQIHGVHLTEETCFVEMEYVPGPDLSDVLADVPRGAIQPLIRQLVSAVQFLESRGLVHRDIKPQNIKVTVDLKHLKLLDLGVVREMHSDGGPNATAHGLRKPFIATAQYSSPEYLFWLHKPSSDLWHGLSIYQVGAVLHDLLKKRQLFADEVAMDNRYALAMAVLQNVPDTYVEDMPPSVCALAARCLTKDLNRRLTMVTWEDFEEARVDAQDIGRRFQQLSQLGLTPLEDGTRRDERLLRRSGLMVTVLDLLHGKIQSTLGNCQLERTADEQGQRLTLRLPNTNLLVDYFLEFRWSELTSEETAAVVTHARLRRRCTPCERAIANVDVGTLTEVTIDGTVAGVFSQFMSAVGTALDIAQVNAGTIENPISLDQGGT